MINLSNDKNRQLAIDNLKSLLVHPGWLIVKDIVEANIEVLKNQILIGVGEETIEEVRRLRDKLSVHEEIINTPETIIEKLTPNISDNIPSDDPYGKIEDKDK